MAIKDSLGDRMKNNYENRAKTFLIRRMPVIIRLDGKAFHTFTKDFKKPYDEIFHNAMNNTMKYLCENIQGCKLGYTQSDEITLLLIDYDTLTTEAWFNYNVQKICSVAASMATMKFNQALSEEIDCWIIENAEYTDKDAAIPSEGHDYFKAKRLGAMFDARCFNIPESEVVNCFVWRQQDATRNAIQMLGQCHFSHKELHKKSCNDIQDMLMVQKGINFNDMPVEFKRGICCLKNQIILEPYGSRMIDKDAKDGEWVLDKNIPIFSQNREYIEDVMFTKVINEC